MVTNVPSAKQKGKFPMKLLVGIALGVVVIGAAYWFVSSGGDDQAVIVIPDILPTATVPTANVQLGEEADDIRAAINILRTINLDTRFLEDPRFVDLRETPAPIPDPIIPQRRTLELFKPKGAEGGE